MISQPFYFPASSFPNHLQISVILQDRAAEFTGTGRISLAGGSCSTERCECPCFHTSFLVPNNFLWFLLPSSLNLYCTDNTTKNIPSFSLKLSLSNIEFYLIQIKKLLHFWPWFLCQKTFSQSWTSPQAPDISAVKLQLLWKGENSARAPKQNKSPSAWKILQEFLWQISKYHQIEININNKYNII